MHQGCPLKLLFLLLKMDASNSNFLFHLYSKAAQDAGAFPQ